MTLDSRHLTEFRASGINDETIEAADVRSVADSEVAAILGWQPRDHAWGRGWAIPFISPGETTATYWRVKLDHPRHNEGKPIKYESPRGVPNRAYFPPSFAAAIASPEAPIVITEGEKKSIAATQHGFACIGLVGVYGFAPKGERGSLIPDLERVAWRGRKVYICYDSDAESNPDIRKARGRLSLLLVARGAIVHAVALPGDGGAKVGIDDFIVAHGAAAFGKLVADAKPAVPEEDERRESPMQLADAFIREHLTRDGQIIARHYRGELHLWTGTHYRPVDSDELLKRILLWLDGGSRAARTRIAREVLECIGARLLIGGDVESPVWLGDASAGPKHADDWIACENGILSLPAALAGTGDALRPHHPAWFTSFALPYGYDPAAECPRWYEFLDQVFDGDEERVELLSQFFGLCLTNDTRYQTILVLQGPRRSGKGTVLRALRRVVGDANCVDPRLSTLGELFGLAGLIGKRVAICADAHLSRGDAALGVLEVLKSISGEDSIEIHRKNLSSINARLRVRFVLGVNDLPRFGDSAGAISSRLLVIPFRQTFEGREDYGLDDALATETPGILNWSLDGLRSLRERGRFIVPAASAELADEFRRLSSPLTAFIEDHCSVGPSFEVGRDALFGGWRDYCAANGHHPGSAPVFGTRLRTLIPNLDGGQRTEAGRRVRVYVGLEMTNPPQAAQAAQAKPHRGDYESQNDI